MSELRKPTEIWFKRLPLELGKKSRKIHTLKIELFPSYMWGRYWEPACTLFSPKLPLHSGARREYWVSRFRVRVNGKWVGDRAKYVMITKQMILKRYFR